MQQSFEIKGIMIGKGRPVVCVPVVAADAKSVVSKIRDLCEQQVRMIEWRADCFEDVKRPECVKAVLEEIRPFTENTVILFTFRTKHQGGMLSLPEKDILYLNTVAAKSGCVDMIDLEFFEASRPQKEIRRFQAMGVKVIASHHDFEATPDDCILHMLMDQMQQGGADVAKLAMMPQTMDDVIRLLKLTNDTKQKYPDLPLVTMSMGPMGVISRIAGEAFGSCITFGTDGQASAPGQLERKQLSQILDILHSAKEGE